MRIIRMLWLGALVLLCGSSALAQNRFEVQPFVGYKWGGSIDLAPNVQGIAKANFNSNVAYGVTATFNATPTFGLEFMWNRQPTTVVGQLGLGSTFPTQIDANLDQFHGNILITIAEEDAKLKPFILFGLGATYASGNRPGGTGNSSTKFSFGIGGGLKYFFSDHIGVRAQIRYAPTYVYSTYGGTYCDWWGFCWSYADDHYLNQGDVTTGIVFRF